MLGDGNTLISIFLPCRARVVLAVTGITTMRTALSLSTLTGIGLVAAALTAPSAVTAQDFMPDIQPLGEAELQTLPPELRTGPAAVGATTQREVGPDGVETIIRTRRIERSTPYPAQTGHEAATAYHAPAHYGHGYSHAYAPGAQVFQREQWIEECEDRTSGRSGREKGGIIGGLLGAIGGGILGNRLFDSERLGGTLLGAGVGGIGGVLLGSLIGGGRNDRGEYDCEAALDGYLSQYAHGGPRIAARTIPAPVHSAPAYAAPAYGYHYGYAPQPYYYAPPQQIVYVPVEYQQRQRVIVRENVREEVIPGAQRVLPAPAPAPVTPPLPRPIKGQPRYIKGN